MNWFSFVYNALLIAGIIVVFTSYFLTGSASLTGSIVGYSIIATGVLLVAGYLMNNIKNSSIISSIITIGPFICLIGILIYMLYLLGFYFNLISSGNVSPFYYTFEKCYLAIIATIIYIFYHGSSDKRFLETGTLGKLTGISIYFFELLSIIIVINIGVILQYFTTDG